jgi:predicted XRE-type DNA-binding protein
MSEEIEIVRGSGNIYRDFNLPDADVRQTKVLLASTIVKVLNERQLSSRQAEGVTGIDHSEFVRIRKPDLKRFTIDRLITILNKLDQNVDVSITITARQHEPASHVHA